MVHKHAKQLRCDVVRHLWMPHLVERIQAEYSGGAAAAGAAGGVHTVAVAAAPAMTTAHAPAAYHLGTYGGHMQSADDVVPSNKDYYSYSEPGQVAAPAAMSPDVASSTLRSSMTGAWHGAQHHSTASAAAPTSLLDRGSIEEQSNTSPAPSGRPPPPLPMLLVSFGLLLGLWLHALVSDR
ncbi:transcription factor MYB108-like [Setaria italica]|uniref:transcription factor MYB108-like n=1 Tax=Setaria italica TaxID=4555 RepID=UPI0007199D1E|nr:transcription factor MYB108-like [Setaria italica]